MNNTNGLPKEDNQSKINRYRQSMPCIAVWERYNGRLPIGFEFTRLHKNHNNFPTQ